MDRPTTWREKLATLEYSARLAGVMLLAGVFVSGLLLQLGCGATFTPPPALTPAPIPTPPPIVTPPPPPTPSIVPLHVDGDHFATPDGTRWYWKGATDFLLLQQVLDGQDIGPILDQRQAAGANLVRVFAMCKNLADFNPSHYADYFGGVRRFLTLLADRGLYAEITVFADAQLVMPNQADQVAFWNGFAQFADQPALLLELVNENSHAGNTINPAAFPPLAGILCSHGSGQTDEHPIEPYWNYITYHARRDGPPSAKGATNYDPLEFESGFPPNRAEIADEGAKAEDYGANPEFARLMGRHARVATGGTFHTAAGVLSHLWSDQELACAKAFFAELQ